LNKVRVLRAKLAPRKKAAFGQFLRENKWVAPDDQKFMAYSIMTENYRYVDWMN